MSRRWKTVVVVALHKCLYIEFGFALAFDSEFLTASLHISLCNPYPYPLTRLLTNSKKVKNFISY
jgi:hypothetical protein